MIAWYYLAILSSLFMGLSTIVEKKALKTEHPTAYSASFATIIAIVSLVFIPWAKFNISIYAVAILYVLSLISTSTYILSAKVYKHSSISVATPILSSLPMFFVVILAFAFLGEKLSLVQYASIAVLIISTYFILSNNDGPKRKYIVMLILISFLSGIGFTVTKYLLGGEVNAFAFLILSEIFIAFNMLVYISVKFGGVREIAANVKANKVPILAIVALAIAYRLTFYFALYTAPVSLAQPLRNTVNILLIVVGGGILFNEGGISKKLVLALIMVACAYVLVA
ncbi:MAG: DMT family transporter [Candidatus Marsarchaeota archaeon]|jgi:drug/metabolite transporter (DMT)-like permease|nr:DMT family transporter [Candidatus Marsarchaeota archaeon]MCL5418611.1 DMT family transporter [Candidatus Marsarchaeota archaeon]